MIFLESSNQEITPNNFQKSHQISPIDGERKKGK
jgi:hypothetical protein